VRTIAAGLFVLGAVLACGVVTMIAGTTAAVGSAGRVPTRFLEVSSSGGWVTTSVGRGSASVSALIQQPDGKLVAAGSGTIMGAGLNIKRGYVALARYNLDGSLDTGFGHGGKVTTSIGRLTSGSTLVRQPDGKLVIAGTSGSNDSNVKIALVRYNSDGVLDKTFGRGGKVTTAIGDGVTLNSITAWLVRQRDGKLVAFSSGYRGAYTCFALVRYREDGSLDTSFGHGGKVTTRINQLDYFPSALIFQPDGKLVAAAGTSSAQASGGFVLVRYNSDGSLDTAFGHSGKVMGRGTTANDTYEGLALLPHGELVAAGAGSYSALTLAAYDKNGKPDTSFGRNGKVTTVLSQVGSISYDGALIAAPNGKLLAAGEADLGKSPGTPGSFIVRYNSHGVLDRSFGRGGEVTALFDAGGLSDALLRQRDGKLVAAGSGGGGSFALARFDTNGSLDTSFGMSASWQPKKVILPAVQAKARSISLKLADLPGHSWKSEPSGQSSTQRCSYYHPNFSDLTENGQVKSGFRLPTGSIVGSEVTVFKSATQGRNAYERAYNLPAVRCLAQGLRSQVNAKIVSLASLALPHLAQRTSAYRIVVDFSNGRGYFDFLFLGRDRINLLLYFGGVRKPFRSSFERGITTLLARRMNAS
jgi:uncharacterized delta-60 repeat protein